MDMQGAILKKRIKEMGYTQEGFAEKAHVPLSTLKKYMSGKSSYPIDLLESFAGLLECSYDYLMGVTLSPRRDIQDIKDATRLSDGAIDRILGVAREAAGGGEMAVRKLASLNIVAESEVLDKIAFYFSEDMQGGLEGVLGDALDKTGEDTAMPFGIRSALALSIIQELDDSRGRFVQEMGSYRR